VISHADYLAMLARMQPRATAESPGPAAVRERDLHEQVLAECRLRRWICFHGSMAHATHRTIGEPDFIILRDQGRVILVEGKRPGGKLTPEQLALKIWAETLGHNVAAVYTFQDFIGLL